MNEAKILALIQEALFEVAPTRQEEFAELTLDAKVEDLALDSIAIMEMVGFVEDRLAQLQTLRDLGKLIQNISAVG